MEWPAASTTTECTALTLSTPVRVAVALGARVTITFSNPDGRNAARKPKNIGGAIGLRRSATARDALSSATDWKAPQ